MNRRIPILSVLIAVLGVAFFIAPLLANFNFSLRMTLREVSFEAYRSVFERDLLFQRAIVFGYGLALGDCAGYSDRRADSLLGAPAQNAADCIGVFLTFSISVGEFVVTSRLNRPGFDPCLVQMGQDYAYEPAALAIMALPLPGFAWP